MTSFELAFSTDIFATSSALLLSDSALSGQTIRPISTEIRYTGFPKLNHFFFEVVSSLQLLLFPSATLAPGPESVPRHMIPLLESGVLESTSTDDLATNPFWRVFLPAIFHESRPPVAEVEPGYDDDRPLSVLRIPTALPPEEAERRLDDVRRLIWRADVFRRFDGVVFRLDFC